MLYKKQQKKLIQQEAYKQQLQQARYSMLEERKQAKQKQQALYKHSKEMKKYYGNMLP